MSKTSQEMPNKKDEMSLEELLSATAFNQQSIDLEGELTDPDSRILEENETLKFIDKKAEDFNDSFYGSGIFHRKKLDLAVQDAETGLYQARKIKEDQAINYFRVSLLESYKSLFVEYIRKPGSKDKVGSMNLIWYEAIQYWALHAIKLAMNYHILELAQLALFYLEKEGVLSPSKKAPIEDETLKQKLSEIDTKMSNIVRLSQDTDINISEYDEFYDLMGDLYKIYHSNRVYPGEPQMIINLNIEKKILMYMIILNLIEEAKKRGLSGVSVVRYLPLDSELRSSSQKEKEKEDETEKGK